MPELNAHEIESGVARDWKDDRDVDYVRREGFVTPPSVGFDNYKMYADEAWHQRGEECTGFALAAIANYQIRSKLKSPGEPSVSRRMLYEMAQVYDGESFVEGSTLRGALKGWKNVGVAHDELWPYDPDDEGGTLHGKLTLARVLDARSRSLIRYQRIQDGDIETMKQALVEGHALYAAAQFHAGWYRLFLSGIEPVIEQRPDDKPKGVHAFVIVGYDERGFWIHNSWGPEWGDEGYARLPYNQWEMGATDVWVTEVEIDQQGASAVAVGALEVQSPEDAKATYRDMWPHLVVLRDDGTLTSSGLYEMDKGSVGTLLYLFDEYTKENEWEHRRLVLIADGGYWSTDATIERLRPMRDQLLEQSIYPIFLVWETPWFNEVRQELSAWMQREPSTQGPVDLVGRQAGVESVAMLAWNEIVSRSLDACSSATGGARVLAESVAYKRNQNSFDLHLVSHGAGDLLMNGLAKMLPPPITSATALAPASTMRQFRDGYREMLDDHCLRHLTVVALDADAERADKVGLVPQSILHLISDVLALDKETARHALEHSKEVSSWTQDPVPLLGMEKFLAHDGEVDRLVREGKLRTEIISEMNHVGLLLDGEVRDLLIRGMLTERSSVGAPNGWGPPMPSDPLAYAEAVRLMRKQNETSLGGDSDDR